MHFRRPTLVEDQDGDHGLLFTHRAAIGVVIQVLGAYLFPIFLFRPLIYTVELLMDHGQGFLLAAAAENTVVSDTDKSLWQNVQGEPSNELRGIQGHDFGFTFIAVILVAKADLIIGDADDAVIGDGDLVGVSPEISGRFKQAEAI